jgi:demethylmacrocin O-methyltransferase
MSLELPTMMSKQHARPETFRGSIGRCDRLVFLVVRLRQWILQARVASASRHRKALARALDIALTRVAPLAGRMGCSLNVLSVLCGTDKYALHYYTPIYHEIMSRARRKPIRLLEIGVGGYASALGGRSLLMWSSFFSKGQLYGIDVEDKTSLSRGRIKVLQCSQVDHPRVVDIAERFGPFDFIIDDGSHYNADQIESFQILWPFVKDRGVYIVEDVQTSYWPAYGGGAVGSSDYERSCMSYFKRLVDSVNYAEFLKMTEAAAALPKDVASVAFHHNLIVIKKDSSPRYSNVRLDDRNVLGALGLAPTPRSAAQ